MTGCVYIIVFDWKCDTSNIASSRCKLKRTQEYYLRFSEVRLYNTSNNWLAI